MLLRIGRNFKSGKKIWSAIAKKIGSTNCKSANCNTRGRSANLAKLVSSQIYGFAICEIYWQTAHP